jgi:hypothetical protein
VRHPGPQWQPPKDPINNHNGRISRRGSHGLGIFQSPKVNQHNIPSGSKSPLQANTRPVSRSFNGRDHKRSVSFQQQEDFIYPNGRIPEERQADTYDERSIDIQEFTQHPSGVATTKSQNRYSREPQKYPSVSVEEALRWHKKSAGSDDLITSQLEVLKGRDHVSTIFNNSFMWLNMARFFS